jgi:hypothetical protein
VGGPASIGHHIQACYASEGTRAFDFHFMGAKVYEKTFQVVACAPEQIPLEHESERSLGRHPGVGRRLRKQSAHGGFVIPGHSRG